MDDMDDAIQYNTIHTQIHTLPSSTVKKKKN